MYVVFANGTKGYFEIKNGVPSDERPAYNAGPAILEAWYERNRVATEARYSEVLDAYCKQHNTTVVDKWKLPYPASPKLHTDYEDGGCPTFCFNPEQCKGLSSCPRRRACDD